MQASRATFGQRGVTSARGGAKPTKSPAAAEARWLIRGVPAGIFLPMAIPTGLWLAGYVVVTGLAASGGLFGGVATAAFAWILFLGIGLAQSFVLTKLIGFFGGVGTTMVTLTDKEGFRPSTALAVAAALGWLAFSPPETEGPNVMLPPYAGWLVAAFVKLAICLFAARLIEKLAGKGEQTESASLFDGLREALRSPGHDVFPAAERSVAALGGAVVVLLVAIGSIAASGEGSLVGALVCSAATYPVLGFALRVATVVLNRAMQAWGYLGDLA